jgi:hypothetical protein
MTDTSAAARPHRSETLALRVAPLVIPFPVRLNPAAERSRQHTLRWLRRFGMVSGDSSAAEYDTLRLERLMAYFYPDVPAADLDLAADFNAWFFVFDDQFDGELGRRPDAVARVVESVVRAMDENGRAPRAGDATPLTAGFRDIWDRATAGTPVAWRRRFRAHWRAYLRAYGWEARNRTGTSLPPLGDFLLGRRDSIGVQPCLDFHERCGGYALPHALHSGRALAEMRRITADVVIFVNDIVSVDKELAVGDVNNSVLMLRHGLGCGLDEAVRRIALTSNSRVEQFLRIAAGLPAMLAVHDVPPPERKQVLHYVDGMRNVMRGTLEWSLETTRYDATGTAAVSLGRERPWAGLTTPQAPPAT